MLHTLTGATKRQRQQAVRKIVIEFILYNVAFLLEDEEETNCYTYLSNSSHNSRPDVSLVHTAIIDDLSTANLDCPTGRDHKIIKLT